MSPTTWLVIAVVVVAFLAVSLRVVQQYEMGVLFVLGRVKGPGHEPGLCFVFPLICRLEKVSMRLEAMDVPKHRPTGRP